MIEVFTPPTDSLHKFKALTGILLIVIAIALAGFISYYHTQQIAKSASNNALRKAELDELETLRSRYITEWQKGRITEKEYFQKVVEAQDKSIEFNKRFAESKSDNELLEFYKFVSISTGFIFLLLMALGALLMRQGFREWSREQKHRDKILKDQATKQPNVSAVAGASNP